MSQIPGRLVYEDATEGTTVIGRFQPQDVTQGNISTFTLDEEALNYKRVIIEGAPELQENMPDMLSDFATSEPEIKVQVDSNLDGTWEDRMRVYPEKGGTTDNRGRYKNKDLWGFKKYYGEDDVATGTISTDLEAVLNAMLPSGYTARYPSGETPPSVSNYSYRGSRQGGFKEIFKHYKHYVIFTNETDGSGNYYVDLQPFGYGGTQFSLVRGQDMLNYDYWEKNDTSEVVSKVKVIGTDSSNQKVERVIAAGDSSTGVHSGDSDVDVYLGSPEPARRRFKRVHVDYTITESEADAIGENVINADSTEHGAIETSLRVSSNLNQSVGILDETRTETNPIDDVFTVVKQKDFLHQGVSYFSFEFENEATQEQRQKWTEHDFERAKLYPENQTDVGQQTAGTLANDSAQADNTTTEFNASPFVGGNTGFQSRLVGYNFTQNGSSQIDGGSFSTSTSVVSFGNDVEFIVVTVNFSADAGTSGNVNITIENTTAGTTLFNEDFDIFHAPISRTATIIERGAFGGDTIEATLTNNTGTSGTFTLDLTVDSVEAHTHSGDSNGGTLETDIHNHSVTVTDQGHGGTGNASEHVISGSTDSKNINVATEDKTDR